MKQNVINCYKKSHATEIDAIMYQQMRTENFVPFMTHFCDYCNAFHISMKGITSKLFYEFLHIIQSESRKKLIEKVSSNRYIFQIDYEGMRYLVMYYKKQKRVEIMKEIKLK